MDFRREPRGKDYGGNAHGKKPYRDGAATRLSYRCRDCSTIRYVSHRELNRAARPRCLGCGGPLMETDSTADKTMSPATAENAKALNQCDPDPKGHCRCWGCNLTYRKNFYLGKHLQESASCREQYKIKGKLNEVGGAAYFAGTFSLTREEGDVRGYIKVIALSADINEWCDVAFFDAIYKAEAFVKPYTVSLHALRIKEHWREQPKPVKDASEIRCPACRSKFVDSAGGKAESHLVRHLVINEYCFANIEPGKLKEQAAEMRGTKH